MVKRLESYKQEYNLNVVKKFMVYAQQNSIVEDSDADRFMDATQHEDIYKWVEENSNYFDLSEPIRPGKKAIQTKNTW